MISDHAKRDVDLFLFVVRCRAAAPAPLRVARQAKRIATLRKAADEKDIPLFINARTDVFFQDGDPHRLIDDVLKRAEAYAEAGASGFFIPGLLDDALIGRICKSVVLPVNVMVMGGVPSNKRLTELGGAR